MIKVGVAAARAFAEGGALEIFMRATGVAKVVVAVFANDVVTPSRFHDGHRAVRARFREILYQAQRILVLRLLLRVSAFKKFFARHLQRIMLIPVLKTKAMAALWASDCIFYLALFGRKERVALRAYSGPRIQL